MKLATLLHDIPVESWIGDRAGRVSSICYDSRRCEADSLFVAVRGLEVDGHDFIGQAVQKGARTVVHEEAIPAIPGIGMIQVPDSRGVLGLLGRNFYGDPSSRLCLVGVIGTNGKTTVTYLLEAILAAAGSTVGVLGTVNYRYNGKVLAAPNTTPESLEMQKILREMADDGVTHVVAEISSHSLDLRRVDACDFDLGIFTNLSQDHLDYHETMEKYFAAKQRFFREVLPAGKKQRTVPMVVNGDDPWGQRLLRETGLSRMTFGIDVPCDLMASELYLSLRGIEAVLASSTQRFPIASRLIGRFNLYNILAAAAAALTLGVTAEDVQAGIEHFSQVPGRLEKVSLPGQPAVFVDYAHTEDALRRVLQHLSDFKGGRLITLFGCGGDRDRGKRPLMARAAADLSDLVIITSDNPRTEDPLAIIAQIEAGIPPGTLQKVSPDDLRKRGRCYAVIPERGPAIEMAVGCADSSDIVLLAGKGHEDYQILGSRRIHFDDRLHARAALEKR